MKRIGEMDGENQELLVEVSRLKEVIASDMVYVIIWVVDDIWWKIDCGFGGGRREARQQLLKLLQ